MKNGFERRGWMLSALTCVALCAQLWACTTPTPRRSPSQAPRAHPAGFLGEYSGFRRIGSGALVYRRQDSDLSRYKTFLIEPLVFWESSEELDAADQTRLRGYFRKALTDAASDRYAFAKEPGPGVMRIRAALTGLRPTESRVVEPSLPSTGDYNDPSTTVERRLGFASVEAELLDSVSQERLFAVVARRDAKRRPAARSLGKWGHIEDIIDVWAKNFRSQLDAWQKAPPPAGQKPSP